MRDGGSSGSLAGGSAVLGTAANYEGPVRQVVTADGRIVVQRADLDLVPPREITVRRLRRVLPRLRDCYGELEVDQRRVLALRAGLRGKPLSRTEAANRLGSSPTKVARDEARGIRELRVLARNGCGATVATTTTDSSGRPAGGPAGSSAGGSGGPGPAEAGAPAASVSGAPAGVVAPGRGASALVASPVALLGARTGGSSAARFPVLGAVADGQDAFSYVRASAGARAAAAQGVDAGASEPGPAATIAMASGSLFALLAAAGLLFALARRRRKDGERQPRRARLAYGRRLRGSA